MQISEDKTSIVFNTGSFCFTVGKNGKALSLKRNDGKELLSDRCYLEADLSEEGMIKLFKNVRLL